MSGIDPMLPAPDDRFETVNDGLSASPPPAYPPLPAMPARSVTRPFPLHPNFWWAILWCIGMLLFTQVPGGILSVILIFVAMFLFPQAVRMDDLKNMGSMMQNPITLICFGVGIVAAHALMIVFSLLLLRIIAGRDWPRQVALRRPSWIHVGLVVAAWPAFSFLANGILYFITQYLGVKSFLFGKDNPAEGLEQGFTGPALLPAIFVIAVMPAFSEELWCRAFLGRGLVGRHGVVFGVLGTSFLFGLIHIDPAQGLMAMMMGILLHYAYLTTRSLLIPMLMHFLNNALAIIAPNIPGLAGLDKNPGAPALALYTGAAVLLAAVCWALYQSRARLVSDGSGPAWQPRYPGVFCPPPGSGTRIETPGLSGVSLALVVAGLAAFATGFVMTMQAIERMG
jgi:membrane protease YdiL (CAAX protease family)